MKKYKVATLSELSEKSVHVVNVEGLEIGLINLNGEVHAIENRCGHQGGPICYGEVLGKVEAVLDDQKRVIGERFSDTKIHIVCPWHGWEYDIVTGENAADPKFKLRKFPTEVRDGEVFVQI